MYKAALDLKHEDGYKSWPSRSLSVKAGGEKTRKARFINEDIGLHTTQPIYLNEHVRTALKKKVHGMNAKRQYECGWKSV